MYAFLLDKNTEQSVDLMCLGEDNNCLKVICLLSISYRILCKCLFSHLEYLKLDLFRSIWKHCGKNTPKPSVNCLQIRIRAITEAYEKAISEVIVQF